MTATATRHVPAEWLSTRDGGLWLAVSTATRRGGLTDGATALDFVGPQSWVYGDTVYLGEDDAFAWLDSLGMSEADIRGRVVLRPPNGYRSVRDSLAADTAAGDPDAAARFYAAAEAAAYPPDGVTVKTFTVTDTPGDAPRRRKWSKAENRALAAEVRALGLVPNGEVWARAKTLREQGVAITAGSLGVNV